MAESISVQELQKLLKENQNLAVIDVRRKNDYEASPHKIGDTPWPTIPMRIFDTRE